jgi:hypothetical protein
VNVPRSDDDERTRERDELFYWLRVAAVAGSLVLLLLYAPAVIDWYLHN